MERDGKEEECMKEIKRVCRGSEGRRRGEGGGEREKGGEGSN